MTKGLLILCGFVCVCRTGEKAAILVSKAEIDRKRKEEKLTWVSRSWTVVVLRGAYPLLSFNGFPKWR